MVGYVFFVLFISTIVIHIEAFPHGETLSENADSALAKRQHSYVVQDTYHSGNWMQMFEAQNISDPTGGFVTYVTQNYAQANNLYKTIGDQVFIGVDNATVHSTSGPGRNSVRLSSNKAYNNGALVIADFAHMPGSACGSWPAFWMVGPNWPSDGEIDIVEGVNQNSFNSMTLHTSPGCVVSTGSGGQTGTSGASADCGADGGYNGCGVTAAPDSNTYGSGFNSGNGGVYAMLWTGSAVQIWFHARPRIPSDIAAGTPDPSTWGPPAANFAGCDFLAHFRDLKLVFDTTFCGAWAGQQSVWEKTSCYNAQTAATCNAYVAANPAAFDDAYWLVNSIAVYN